jgi:hypothetical protein
MSPLSPRTADTIRKVVAYLAAGIGTIWLLRVLFRAAHGKLAWDDAELWAFLALLAVMVAWVRAARPVARRASGAGDEGPSTNPDGGPGTPGAPTQTPGSRLVP